MQGFVNMNVTDSVVRGVAGAALPGLLILLLSTNEDATGRWSG